MTASHVELDRLGRFIVLPAGAFVAGNEKAVTDWDGVVRPEYQRNGPARHTWITRPFALLETPVTVAAFRAAGLVVAGDTEVFSLAASGQISDRWQKTPFEYLNQVTTAPVVGVTWDEAASFCVASSARLGVTIRLPTEIEWEYACRATTSTLYFWGDEVRSGADYAWFDRNSGMRVHPVAEKRSNPWGFYDLAGNVWEWCAGGDDVRKPIRGGSACHHATSGRSAHRFEQPRTQRNAFLGFRCVLELRP